MTWQLLGSGDGPWEIQDTEAHRRVALIRHCDLPTARLFAAALSLQEALVDQIEWAAVGGVPGCERCKHRCQQALRLAAATGEEKTQ